MNKKFVLPKYFFVAARKILLFPKFLRLGGGDYSPLASQKGTAMAWTTV